MKNLISEYTEPINPRFPDQETKRPQFSYFKAPIMNSIPRMDIGIQETFKAIRSDYYKSATALANQKYLAFLDTGDKKSYSQIKTTKFDYCTFSGTFSKRGDKYLISHSGFYCMDSDHIINARALIDTIINLDDPFFEVELCFRSMSYFGVKWVISLKGKSPEQPHSDIYKGLQAYIKKTYGIKTDNTSEVSRACFLSHDSQAFINPKYLI